MHRSCSPLVLSLFALSATFVWGQLSDVEMRIVSHAEAGAARFATDLEEAVNTSSATEDIAGVERMGAVVVRQLAELGFDARWVPLPPESGRAGHVVAELRGTRGRRMLIIGHIDTVYPGGNFSVDGDRALGSGVNDMKGGNLVAIHALRAMRAAGALDGAQIIAIFTGDEESPGKPLEVVREALLDAARRSDVALAFETAIGATVTVARRSSMAWTLETGGVSTHSSGIFSESVGYGAVYEAARILNSFREELRDEDGLTFNAALVAGGATASLESTEARATGKSNIVAGRAVVRGDLRAVDQDQIDRVKAKMQEIVARNLAQTSANLKFNDDGYPPMAATPENYALLAQLDKVSRDLGYGGVEAFDPKGRGAGDISFVAPIIPGLDGLGIRGDRAHSPDESADIASVPELIKRTAVLIHRLSQ
jgi:glutamate carboxypeptidase